MTKEGNLYVFASKVDVDIQWLVVREHPDDPLLLMVVPVDTFPLAGHWDFRCGGKSVRCGQAHWVPADALRHKAGGVALAVLSGVRTKLAALARGQSPPDPYWDDDDPQYQRHMSRVEEAGRELP